MADAGMGKGSLKYCREIVAPIHNELREASEQLMKQYKESKSESKPGEKDTSNVNEAPHRRTLFIPTNSSAASVIQQLDNNGGVGLIFDTECDTLSAILKSEYGDYSTIIRKSYHHEAIDLSRLRMAPSHVSLVITCHSKQSFVMSLSRVSTTIMTTTLCERDSYS